VLDLDGSSELPCIPHENFHENEKKKCSAENEFAICKRLYLLIMDSGQFPFNNRSRRLDINRNVLKIPFTLRGGENV